MTRDLFAYGTLQPGRSLWPAIADLVDVVGPARCRGRLVATPMGWPAATFDAEGTVHGTLLRPRGPRSAARLRSVADRIEAAGDLFVRVTIEVDGPDGRQPAVAYAWNLERGQPPGRPLPDGRWEP
ncbi:MAG: gamma-glutamylcyclotransferase [Actinomycetota bacterium]|nr:gamma-glutamylcyclotransferase [Actinomycetota bacterium]